MGKKRVLLIMRRKILSDALVKQAKSNARFELCCEQNYSLAVLTAEASMPDVAVVEVPESGIWKEPEKCLRVCDVIRKQVPGCKQVLLCSENDETSCKALVQAKRDNRIDDFLYYETSVSYLFSKLESLL